MSQTAPPSPIPSLIDPAVLSEHCDLLGLDFAREVVAKFLESAPTTVDLIARSVAEGDLGTLAQQAHKLASGALTLGLPALNALCREAEHRARAGDGVAASAAAAEIPAALGAAHTALTTFLTSRADQTQPSDPTGSAHTG